MLLWVPGPALLTAIMMMIIIMMMRDGHGHGPTVPGPSGPGIYSGSVEDSPSERRLPLARAWPGRARVTQ